VKKTQMNSKMDTSRQTSILERLGVSTLRKKLIVVILLVTSIAVIISGLTMITFQVVNFRKHMVEDLHTQAMIVGTNSQAALAFNDVIDASLILSSLEAKDTVAYANVTRQNDLIMAEYRRPDFTGEPTLDVAAGTHRFDDHWLTLKQEIRLDDGRLVGTILIQTDLHELDEFTEQGLITILVIIIVVMFVALLLSYLLQRVISAPIQHLKDITTTITENEDYALRASKYSNDEVGILTDSFNAMLSQIEFSDNQLRVSELRFRNLIERINDVVFKVEMQTGEILDISPSIEIHSQYSVDELLGRSVTDIQPRGDRWEGFTTMLDHHPRIDDEQVELVDKDGTPMFFSISGSVEYDEDTGRIFYGTLRNMSERKRAEEEKSRLESQLRQAYKMEAIGTMAGGIAHDFNNMLAIIMGNAEIALEDIEDPAKARLNVQKVLTTVERGKELVRQILIFGREHQLEKRPINSQTLVSEWLNLIKSTIPATVKIRPRLEEDCGPINADPVQINQLLMNLCMNAVHAMNEKGDLSISLQQVQISVGELQENEHQKAGSYVRLSVSDTGSGMDANTLERIFDPFFTTKEVGKGTGIGLWVVRGIVDNHDGHITVESEPGKGSTFNTYFPVSLESVQSNAIIESAQEHGDEAILFVDDEIDITLVGEQVLSRLGYRITVSTSSLEALRIFKEDPGAFDLIITDQTMPELSGSELAMEILKIRSEIPIILCSGFSSVVSESQALQMGISEFILKPFRWQQLSGKVRQLLNKQPGMQSGR